MRVSGPLCVKTYSKEAAALSMSPNFWVDPTARLSLIIAERQDFAYT
jgi:hypothetical protein